MTFTRQTGVLFAFLFTSIAFVAGIRFFQSRPMKAEFSKKFDLICRSSGRALNNKSKKRPPPAGYLNALKWQRDFRYAVNFAARQFDMIDPPPAEPKLPHSIARIDRTEVTFIEDENIFETYEYTTGKYFRIEMENGILSGVVKGTCRRAQFSGFPEMPAKPVDQ